MSETAVQATKPRKKDNRKRWAKEPRQTDKPCLYCGNPISVHVFYPAYLKARKFCSAKCAADHRAALKEQIKERSCTTCKAVLPKTEEHFRYVHRTQKDGVRKKVCSGVCKKCDSRRVTLRTQTPEGRAQATINRKRLAGRRMGLTNAQVDDLLAGNSGACEVCERIVEPRSSLNLDHDHETGAFRGLLCKTCNMTLGLYNDDTKKIGALIKYLEKHGK